MAKALRSDLRMHTAGEELRRVAMSKIVKPDPRHILDATYEAGELVRQTERLMRLTVGTRAEQGFARLPDAEREQCFGLLAEYEANALASKDWPARSVACPEAPQWDKPATRRRSVRFTDDDRR
jgi:hypothetical protein